MQSTWVLTAPDQLQALGHPTRHRILHWLVDQAATNQQIAAALGEPPARIHFHVRELLAAGLIVIAEERAKGGVIEKYYRAVARSFCLGETFQFGRMPPELVNEALGFSILATADQDLRAAVSASPDGTLRPFVSAQFQGALSSDAVARVQELVTLIGQEFDRGGVAEATVPFTMTLLFHPQAISPEEDGDEKSLEQP